MPQIKTIELANGEKHYRFKLDVGKTPEGKRQQRNYTYERLADARAELARLSNSVHTSTFVDRSKMTVGEMCDRYERHAAFGAEENTKVSYRDALKPARARLGGRLARSVDREDVEQLRDWMLTSGRRRGGKPGTGLGARSVRLTLGRLSAAFDLACADRKLAVNPCQYVDLPKVEKSDPDTWSAEEVALFLAAAAEDRLHAAWRLTLYGLRRAEVCGLRWEYVDLEARMLTVAVTRPVVDGKVITKAPKSQRGLRTLPLDEVLVTALRALRKAQVTERLAAGEAYTASGYVVADELGEAVHPEWYSDEFHRLRERAGVRRIVLKNGRATASTLMADAGVPDHIRAAWCGHRVEVNLKHYTAVRPERLADALGALSKIHNGV